MWQLAVRRLAADPRSPRLGLAHRTCWRCSVRMARHFPPMKRSYLCASVSVTPPAASCRALAATCCAGALPLRSQRVPKPGALGSYATPSGRRRRGVITYIQSRPHDDGLGSAVRPLDASHFEYLREYQDYEAGDVVMIASPAVDADAPDDWEALRSSDKQVRTVGPRPCAGCCSQR
jgi:hypothetical protein